MGLAPKAGCWAAVIDAAMKAAYALFLFTALDEGSGA